jgi:hypothetical protein
MFWSGAVFYLISFLVPAFREVGPDGAKVFASLRRRRMFTWIPVIATVTVLSGFWLYMMRMGGGTGWAMTREAMWLGTGGVTGTLALILGVVGMRAPTLKADDLSGEAGAMAPGADRDAKMALAQKLRGRALMSVRATATLLLITVIAMAIARYR